MLIEALPEALTGQIATWLAGEAQRDADFTHAIYAALHRLAAQALGREAGAHTLQPTALLNEAFLNLSQQRDGYRDRNHFFATATLCMRHILVDHARRRKADKRGDALRVEWNDYVVETAAPAMDFDLVALDFALNRLQKADARRAQVLQLAYFGGFKREEVADLLEISLRTVDRELRLGEAWLAQALT